jgi:1-deoxy-D-xylulose-5-phosphate synthase
MAPADPPELGRMLAHALALPGPSAIRWPRGSDPDVSLPGNERALVHGRGALLRDGTDLAFLAYGTMVRPALEAARRLEARGVSAAVWNARFARPLDGAAVEALARRLPLLVTVEEHAVAGGFGSAVLEHLASLPTPAPAVVRVLGVPDRLVPQGDRDVWLARFGLSAEALCEYAVRECEAARAHRR